MLGGSTPHAPPRRHGYTLVEFIVAMVVLGVAMAGLYPLLIVQSRALESLELRYTGRGNEINETKTWFSPVHRSYLEGETIPRGDEDNEGRENYGVWYMQPNDDPWARKIGAAATPARSEPSGNDASEPPYIADDGDDNYREEEGTWDDGDPGYEGDSKSCDPPADVQPAAAAWTFNVANLDIHVGYYHVYATWPDAGDQDDVENAEYTVNGGDGVTVNQYNAPDGEEFDGRTWMKLTDGNPCLVDDDTTEIVVRIASKQKDPEENSYAVADAVRIVPVNKLNVISVSRCISSPDKTTVKVKVEENYP